MLRHQLGELKRSPDPLAYLRGAASRQRIKGGGGKGRRAGERKRKGEEEKEKGGWERGDGVGKRGNRGTTGRVLLPTF